MAIKEIVREELDNSLRMEKGYVKALAELPRGSLVKKVIGGRVYYYLAHREGAKVVFDYMGSLDADLRKKYERAKVRRAQYRKLLAQVRAQIKFLRKMLNAKQSI